ncbi:MAG TPA: SDR family oxidoreductase [Planctomycetaceae bacterium]|nr:SDR family oxidoreductase [Planctomycetaceae bacterium]
MANYLVTGGAGFIGSHLATALVERGESVRVFDDLSTGSLANLAHLLPTRVEFVQGDVTNRKQVEQAVRDVDVVFHHAALASVPRSVADPLETHAADTTGTVTLLDACRHAGVRRVVYAASSSCYGNRPEMPKTESHLPQVLSPYAAAKLAGELYCEAFAACYSLETVRLRYFNVFGPRQDPKGPYSAVIPLFAAALLEGRQPTIFGDGSQSRDFTYVENIVQANLLAATAAGISGRVYNIACGHSSSVLELLTEICSLLGKPFDPRFAPPRPGDVEHSSADISAARRELGYVPSVDLHEGLRRTIKWYAENTAQRAEPKLGG